MTEQEKLYHISDSGVLVECNAKVKACPKGRHFTNIKEGQAYADRKNRAEALPNGSTESRVKKKDDYGAVFRKNNVYNQLMNTIERLNKPNKSSTIKYFYKKTHKDKVMKLNEFRNWYKTNKDQCIKDERRRLAYQIKKLSLIIQQKDQAQEILKDNKDNIVEFTESAASASLYMVLKEESLNDTINYFENNGYEVLVRPDIDVALVENFQVRVADHEPPDFLRSKDCLDIDKVWQYTDASVLVTYKDIKDDLSIQEVSNVVSRYR